MGDGDGAAVKRLIQRIAQPSLAQQGLFSHLLGQKRRAMAGGEGFF